MTLRIFLLFLLILGSCTVTKRIHRKGYHIEWHKNDTKTSKISRKTVDANTEKKQADLSADVTTFDSLSNTSETDKNFEKLAFEETNLESDIADQTTEENSETDQNFSIQKIINENKFISKSKAQNSKIEDTDSDSGHFGTMSYLLLSLGFLFLVGSFFLVFGYLGLEVLFELLVFGGNGILLGVLGFILFLLILVLVGLFILLIEAIGGVKVGLIIGITLMLVGLVLLIIDHTSR